MTRLVLGLAAAAALLGSVLVAPSVAAGTEVARGGPDSITPAWIGDDPVWVVTDDQGAPTVISAVNPHPWFGMKELVGWCPARNAFEGFYDGSRFDREGNYAVGPAPHGLARYPVTGGDGDRVQVGGILPPPPRGTGTSTPLKPGNCRTDSFGGRPPTAAMLAQPAGSYHTTVPRSHEVLEGVVVVTNTGGTFCDTLATRLPPSCGDAGVPVLDAQHGDSGWVAVINARFLVRRSARGLHDVTVLPHGYSGGVEVEEVGAR